MNENDQTGGINFNPDRDNLFREETFTDFKAAFIKRLVPVKADGTDDNSREPVYIGHTRLMSPQGVVPVQARLAATTLEEALDKYPETMKDAVEKMIEQAQRMQQEMQKKGDSGIIMPGR